MKRHKNSIFKRVLSCVMVVVMIIPLSAMLFPIVASAAEVISESSTPRVSLSWDTSTVTVIDGVAMPYKNAGSTASSYTMKYKIIASGTVNEPITVKVQSFDISAAAGQSEYAKVDTKVTLTAQSPTAEGTVTVYRSRLGDYATKVISVMRKPNSLVYTIPVSVTLVA